MSFLDKFRNRFSHDDDYYEDDDAYDDDEYLDEVDDEPEPRRHAAHTNNAGREGSGVLGNTPRPEAESVSVYTRSGRPVGSNERAGYTPRQAQQSAPTPSSSSYTSAASAPVYNNDTAPATSYANNANYSAQSQSYGGPAQQEPVPEPQEQRVNSGQLPPYVLKPQEYEDVQMVIRRVRTNQPVILVLNDTEGAVAQRILDFSLGLACGIKGKVQALSNEVFAVLPASLSLSDADIEKLISTGDLKK